MSMSKKDYVAIAQVMRTNVNTTIPGEIARDIAVATIRELAAVFAADNPRFDKAVFLKACGVAA